MLLFLTMFYNNYVCLSTAEWNISNTTERGSERCRRKIPRTSRFWSIRRRKTGRRITLGTTAFTGGWRRAAGCHARAGRARPRASGAQPADAWGQRVPVGARARRARASCSASVPARAPPAPAGAAAAARTYGGAHGVGGAGASAVHSTGPAGTSPVAAATTSCPYCTKS